jgi:hypothetical protein
LVSPLLLLLPRDTQPWRRITVVRYRDGSSFEAMEASSSCYYYGGLASSKKKA